MAKNHSMHLKDLYQTFTMEWISILKCPVTGSRLRLMSDTEIRLANEKILGSQLIQANGSTIESPLHQGLINDDGSLIFPVIQDIFILLKELAIVSHVSNQQQEGLHLDKRAVRGFYDEKGWRTDDQGIYTDAILYEDLREVSRDYIKKCHDRVNRFLNPSGRYLLDAASGPLQFDDYLQYSANYTRRICVDFSFRALFEAKKKLGAKGIYILCDMVSLPFEDGTMDGFVSLNTIYHIPKDEQVAAIKELYRVLGAGGKGVVVYDWYKHSAWMNAWLFPFRAFVFIKNRLLGAFNTFRSKKINQGSLYFYAHPPKYFKQYLPPYQLKVWRSLSVHFMRYYIHSWLFGKEILNWVYKMEEKKPETCGLRGEYPMLVFEKNAERAEEESQEK